jgi:phage terminase small subunit
VALTGKQRVFIEAYLDCLNATEAASRAGYAKPRQQGSRLLTNVDIRAAVDEGLSARAMGRTEVLTRLAEMARADMRDFVETEDTEEGDGTPRLVVRKSTPLHLIKEMEVTRTTRRSSDGEYLLYDTKIKIKLHDAKAALDTLARVYRLVSDGDSATLSVTAEQLTQMSDDELDELARKRKLL